MKKSIIALMLFGATLGAKATDRTDWMSAIDDRTYVSQLSIPGTHDSATGHGWTGFYGVMGGATMATTQERTIAEQLELGVRALDLRPGVAGDHLYLFHGKCQTKLGLWGALNACRNFLAFHPGEFIFISMRHETEGDSNNSKYAEMAKAELSNFADYIVDFDPELTVGDCRGKIIITSRDDIDFAPMGRIYGWSNNTELCDAYISRNGREAHLLLQDHYDCTGDGGITVKTQAISALMNKSRYLNTEYSNVGTWVINHCSGYMTAASSASNKEVAELTSKAVIYILKDTEWLDDCGPSGIMMMDFAGCDAAYSGTVSLIDAIIDNNEGYMPIGKYAVTKKPVVTFDGKRLLTIKTPEGCPPTFTLDVTIKLDGEVLVEETYRSWTWNFDTKRYTLETPGKYIVKAKMSGPSYPTPVSTNKTFTLEDTAIEQVESDTPASPIYNLQGLPVARPTHGLYIINGRKILR